MDGLNLFLLTMPTINTMAATTGTPLNSNDPLTALVSTLVTSFRPLYTTLIITCIWSAMLVPLSVVLLFFSNSELRRKPVFLGNVFALCLGISLAGVILGLDVSHSPVLVGCLFLDSTVITDCY